MESLKLLFLVLGLLLRKAAEHISTPVSTRECKCPHSAGACTLALMGGAGGYKGCQSIPVSFLNDCVSCINGQQTVSDEFQW